MEPKKRALDTLRKIRTIAELFEKSGMFPGAQSKPAIVKGPSMNTSASSLPRRGIIVTPSSHPEEKKLNPQNEVCTAVANSSNHLFTGDYAGMLTVYDKKTGDHRRVKIDRHSAPIRAIGIGQNMAVIVFGGSIKFMNLENNYLHFEPIDLKRYYGTDRSSSMYARHAAMRFDDTVFAIICGDGDLIVVQTEGNHKLLKREKLLNNNSRGIYFAGSTLMAFDENNRRYVIEY